MAEYIEREALLSAAKGYDWVTGLKTVLKRIPAADVRPVVRGKWIMNDESRTVCSLCGNVVAFVSHPDRRWDFGNFCPNCGADMRLEPPKEE
jgi:ribosomal protein S27AE